MYDDPQMLAKFRDYMRGEIIDPIIPSNIVDKRRGVILDSLTDEAAMRVALTAFIHQSVNANNYECLEMPELIGDRISGSCFTYFLYTNFPNIDQGLATIIFSKYMKGESQTAWGRKLGLDKWIQSYLDITKADIEDTFEALFGVLLIIGNRVSEGFGYVLTSNLMARTIEYLQIDLESVEKDPKTIIKEFFTSMGWPDSHPFKPSEVLVVRRKRTEYDILEFHLTRSAIRSIANMKKMSEESLTGPFVSVRVESGGKDMPVFAEAYKKLKGLGYDMTKKIRETSYSKKVRMLAKAAGYETLILKSIKLKESNNTLHQMVGERPRGPEDPNPTLIPTYRVILRAIIAQDKMSHQNVIELLEEDYIKHGESPKPRTAVSS